MIIGSQSDPYTLTDLTPFNRPNGFTSSRGRTPVDWRRAPGERLGVVFIWGQSNSVGTPNSTTYPVHNPTKLLNLNPSDGGVYQSFEPMLGGGVGGGAFSTQVFDQLIDDGFGDRWIICSMGIGDSKSAEWAPGGYLHHRMRTGIARINSLGLVPWKTLALTHQGESDNAGGTTGAAYSTTKAAEIATVRSLLNPHAVFIAQASYFNGAPSAAIRAAQAALVDNVNVFSLGDFDVIPPSGRDLSITDYNTAGIGQAALIAYTQVRAWLTAHP